MSLMISFVLCFHNIQFLRYNHRERKGQSVLNNL